MSCKSIVGLVGRWRFRFRARAVGRRSGDATRTRPGGAAGRARQGSRDGEMRDLPLRRPDRQRRRLLATGMGRAVRHDGGAAEGSVGGDRRLPREELSRAAAAAGGRDSGPATVSIKEWVVPSLGSRPHDPEPGPGGTIWWTGMFANVIGRFDPKTGAFKEYPVKTPASGPHGLEFDSERQPVVHRELEGLHRQARSEDRRHHASTSCRLTSAIRTRRCSIRTARSGSRRRTRTTSDVSIRRPATSRSSRRRRRARTRTAW